MILNNINATTLLALLVWPVIALWLYTTRPVGRATLWTILGGYLLLPTDAGIKFELIPNLDKNSIPSIAAFLACMIFMGRRIRFGYGFGLPELLILTLLTGLFITSVLNGDTIVIGQRVLPGVGIYDAASATISQFIVLIPFFLGRQILRSATDIEDILRILVLAGLAYSLLMLFEIRMSPQLQIWIYGYVPNDMQAQFREGGFRPAVFLGHGLPVAFFAMTSVVAAAAQWRTQTRIARLPAAGVTAYLGTVLVFCKSLGALVYAAFLVPLVRWASPWIQLRVAMVFVVIALSYPILRTMDLVPTTFLLETAESVSPERALSLQTRFTNERQLLDRASERFWFGWGRFGRSRVYGDTGADMSLTDGYWIITMGQFGFVGFLAIFGLLALTVFRAASALRFTDSARDRINLAALALIIAVHVVDLLPNAGLSPWSWLLTGALLGRAEALRIVSRDRARIKSYSGATKLKAST